MTIQFKTDCLELNEKYESALAGLEKNTMFLFDFAQPVLIEGGNYRGIWLECGPLEASVYGMIRPEVAVASHRIFFKHQRDDGYIPLRVIAGGISTSQIQMVVPIAATALEVYKMVKEINSSRRPTRLVRDGMIGWQLTEIRAAEDYARLFVNLIRDMTTGLDSRGFRKDVLRMTLQPAQKQSYSPF